MMNINRLDEVVEDHGGQPYSDIENDYDFDDESAEYEREEAIRVARFEYIE
jgi:hypothetical protein